MHPLNLPACKFKIKTEGQRTQIFDRIRKKYVALTPEEWVRQHFIHFLVEQKKYPESLMAVEMPLKYNRQQKRGDIIIFNSLGKPFIMVECKAPEIKITQDVFDQAARYNMALKVEYLLVTNGLEHYYCRINYETNSYDFLEELPENNSF